MVQKITLDLVEGLTGALAGKAPTGDYATNSGVTSAIATAVADAKSVLGTAQTTTSGTAKDFTGIPAWVKKITVLVADFSHSSGSNSALIVQLGDSGGFVTTGYLGAASVVLNASTTGAGAVTNGLPLTTSLVAAVNIDAAVFTLHKLNGNLWVGAGVAISNGTVATYAGGGRLTLTGVLDRLRVTTNTGATFDAGTVNILYE